MKSNLPQDWQVFQSPQALADQALQSIIQIASEAINQRQGFHFVTAGGSTPLQIYKMLAEFEKTSQGQAMNWQQWFIYIGDERCLAESDSERNSLALQNAWLSDSAIPAENVFIMPAELGANEAAKSYESVVKGVEFDLVLLGMGEDGHTASLFPGHSHEHQADQLVQTEFNSPKAPPERVTLSAACLGNARQLFKLISGAGKQAAVKEWLAGVSLPIAQVNAKETTVLISQESLPA
ncbi:MAG: 6-phosphogluconolactonase [Thiomicrorhabdus sp.]|nr:MAG: 6-phosphogluconolactonase [Thiomicrorhabdus sp.]